MNRLDPSSYVAEFMRLYEQYHARFAWNRREANPGDHTNDTFKLTLDNSWPKKDYTTDTMQYLFRKAYA